VSGYTLTQAADADLADIARYTVGRWGYEQAETYLLAFEDAFQKLAAFPDTGRPIEERAGYFRHERGSHAIFYRKEPEGILIVRVLHQRMEPRRHLPASSHQQQVGTSGGNE
jgi:toxin ParE1/3/4